ncbi:MAG TPA: hypothetical protein VIL36_00385 [Acidimicrobiales bacterium]
MVGDLPATYVATRQGLHAVAEHVLAAALHRATGRIGLRPTPGGFGTPWFGGRRLGVEGVDLVVEERDDAAGAGSGAAVVRARRAPLTTVGEAATFAGVEPGAPAGVYPPATPLVPGAPLALDPAAAAVVHDWCATVGAALAVWRAELVARGVPIAGEPQLWPEHFDLALVAGEVNYGGSPGDDDHDEPYAYVGPWRRDGLAGEYWNEPFGASRPRHDLPDPRTVVAFFRAANLE